jgi:autotransporter-associated beta strand protein
MKTIRYTSIGKLSLALFLTTASLGQLHAAPLTWGSAGAGGTGTWDSTTTNWFDGALDVVWPAAPGSGDDDAVFGGTAGTITIAPGGVIANDLTFNVDGYLIQGAALTLDAGLSKPIFLTAPNTTNTISAVIGGTNGFNKYDTGTLILTGSNSFYGNVQLGIPDFGGPASGTLRITQAAALGVRGDVVQADGSTNQFVIIRADGTRLELDGSGGDITLPDSIVFITSGPNGVIRNVAGNNVIYSEILATTGVSDTTIKSDGGALELAGPIHCGSSSRIVRLEGTNSSLNIVSGVISNGTGAGLTRLWKRFGVNTWMLTSSNSYSDGTFIGNDYNSAPYVSDGFLRLAHNNALGTGGLTIRGGYQAGGLELTGNITVNNALALTARQGPTYPHIRNVSGTNTLTGNMAISANGARLNFESAAGLLTISGNAMTATTATNRAIALRGTGAGIFAKNLTAPVIASLDKFDSGIWTLSGNNTYPGPTIISQGILSVTGSLTNTALTNNGGTLSGTGTLNGPVAIQAAGTLEPGVSAGLGETLTIKNDLTLVGTALVQIGKSGATPVNDSVVGVTNITYGGTLIVTNATGATFVAGDGFVLFNASGTKTGNFTNIVVTPAEPSLIATFNPASGTLSFASAVVPQPTLNFTNSGGGLEFSWTGAFKLQSQTNALNVGVGTNWSDYPGGGTSPVNVPVDAANPAVFFRLSQ